MPLIARFRELLDAVPFADVYPALEQLREHYALGVLTNGPMPESVLRRMGFAHYFDDVVTVFGGVKKPAAAAFERGPRCPSKRSRRPRPTSATA